MVKSEELVKKEANVFWWGNAQDLDDLLVSFIKNSSKGFGVTFAQLENYFVYRQNLCTSNRLINHLKSLLRHKMLSFDVCRGLKFYKVMN